MSFVAHVKNTFCSFIFLCWRPKVRFPEDLKSGKSSSALVTRLIQGAEWGCFSPEEGLLCLESGLFLTVVPGDPIKDIASLYRGSTAPNAEMTQV